MSATKAATVLLATAAMLALPGALYAQTGLLNARPSLPLVPSTGVQYWIGNQPPASVYEQMHPVAPLLGRQFQQQRNYVTGVNNGTRNNFQGNGNNGGYNNNGGYAYNGNGYANNGGYTYNGYAYGNNTTLVPDGNGGYYVLGNGNGYDAQGYAYANQGSNQIYQAPLSPNDPNGPSVTVLPNPITYAFSGDPIPITQPSVTNIYNQYNYYGGQAQQTASPSAAAQPSAAVPDPSVATPSARSAVPSGTMATPGTSATPGTNATPSPITVPPSGAGSVTGSTSAGSTAPAKPDDADLLAAAYKDIQRSWVRGDITLLRKHTDSAVSIQVMSGGKYQYNIATDKFVTSTDDMFDQIQTQSFTFTALRKLTNGDIAAYATQVYNLRTNVANGTFQTIYIAYVMSKRPSGWVIVAVDSSSTPILQSASAGAGA